MSADASIPAVVQDLAGNCIPRSNYPDTLAGYQDWLAVHGVRRFTAAELCRPAYPELVLAADLPAGWRRQASLLVPPVEWQPRQLVLCLVLDWLRSGLSQPIRLKHAWRPSRYNAAVKGAKASDHLTAHAVDAVFADQRAMLRALELAAWLYRQRFELQLAIGVGAQTLHIGAMRAHRAWHYSTAPVGAVRTIFPEALASKE
jgi:hypothetical protein